MEAVATYAIPFHTAMGCLRKRSVTAQSCVDTLAEELEPERQLRSTFNRVAVYGTEQAYRAGWRLYNAMLPFGNDHVPADRAPAPVPTAAPPTSGPRREFKLAPAVPMTVPPSADSPDEMESIYDDAYNEFIRVMCAELPAVPRASC